MSCWIRAGFRTHSHDKILSRGNIKEDARLKIDGVNIERVYHTKFLGVEIDCKLRWREHVNNIQTKIAKNISVL